MLTFAFRGLVIGLAAAILSGCGGQNGATAVPQGVAGQSRAHRMSGESWMLPEASGEDLLYVGSFQYFSGNVVSVFSYPDGKLVGQLAVDASELCSDSQGNVFVTQGSVRGDDSKILEYAHGGTQPIETLSDPYNGAYGCSVDPATENLAVANTGHFESPGTVLVYPKASGTPTVYQFSYWTLYCAYNGNSDLFVTGNEQHRVGLRFPLAELARGSTQFTRVKLKKKIYHPMGIQWDGTYLAAGDGTLTINNARLRRYRIEGKRGILVSGIRPHVYGNSFFIQGSTVIIADGVDTVWLLSYPGGSRESTISLYSPLGVTVSVAPSRSRIRK